MPPVQKHPGGNTIRQQAKRDTRDVVKPVLANPLTVAWPSLPNHLQTAVLAAVPALVPPEVAEYHVSRARCSRAAKRERKKSKGAGAGAASSAVNGDGDVEMKEATEASASSDLKQLPTASNSATVPPRPGALDHLVLGLNETIKALEHGIDDLRFRIVLLGDALAGRIAGPPTGTGAGAAATTLPRFLPTAATPAEPAVSAKPSTAQPTSRATSPPAYVLVPHLSVSPLALVDPLPTYAATYNTLLRQHATVVRMVRATLPAPERWLRAFAAGGADAPPPEIRIVPLGRREADLAAAVGLRRIAAMAVRASHPEIGVLDRLLPRSVLPPAVHSVAMFPTSSVVVHHAPGQADGESKENADAEASRIPTDVGPESPMASTVPYAPLHIKALHTTAPLDGNARKARRLTEVRRKRTEKSTARREARAGLERRVREDVGKGKAARSGWRKARIAARAERDAKGGKKRNGGKGKADKADKSTA